MRQTPLPPRKQPLVDELNAVLVQNRERLARARAHVANLAHGLKTPLAALAARLDGDTPASAENRQLLELMNRRIAHHLRRARSAAAAGGAFPPIAAAAKTSDLAEALRRIHAGRDITVTLDVPVTLSVRCDTQDLDEMLGDLLDNAFKWARSAIRIEAASIDASVAIRIVDDGPGLAEDHIEQALAARGSTRPSREPDSACRSRGRSRRSTAASWC